MDAIQYKLLLGGIGDDAHSIGIRLLELGFREAGFFVRSLGIRNQVEAFFENANDYDIILISNKNGHAELYLSEFPRLLSAFKLSNDEQKLWYVGGSLSVSESDFRTKKFFLDMGFTNVYPKPVDLRVLIDDIKKDIHRYNIHKKYVNHGAQRTGIALPRLDYNSIINRKWTREELSAQRKQVLEEWPTGNMVKDNTVAAYANGNTVDNVLRKNKRSFARPLFQPRTGVADIEQQIELLQFLEAHGSDISSVQLDASSRSREYAKAELGRDISISRKRSALNGFPIPVYGVAEVRRLLALLKTPFQLRGGGPDHRFTYEIALKAGISAVEGGAICYLLPYDKQCSPVASLQNWQYIDRLCAHYEEEHRVLINREYFGVLTAALIEPSLAILVNVIQSLLSAQQGVKSITVGYAEQGNRSQDIAAMQVMEEMVMYYLHRSRYFNCSVTTVFHQYMAAFPSEYAKAQELIFGSGITATLAGATKVMVKTAVEAINIPDKYENAKALGLCQRSALAANEKMINHQQVEIERRIIRKEVRLMMNAVLELGNNNVAVGAIKAIEQGIIDIPWSPSIYNHNKVMCVRDIDGAVRFILPGNLPFDEEIKEFHFEKINMRTMMERDSGLFSLLEKDLTRIWKNDYMQWPLDNNYVV